MKTTTYDMTADIRRINDLTTEMSKVCNDILNRTLEEKGGEISLSCPNYDSWDDAWEKEGHCYPSNLCPVSIRVLMRDGYMHEIYLTRVYQDDRTGDIRYEGYDDEEGYTDQQWQPEDDLNQMTAMVKFIRFIQNDK